VTVTVPADRSHNARRPHTEDLPTESAVDAQSPKARGHRSAYRLAAAGLGLAVGAAVVVTALPASAEPSPAQARRKVEKLNEEVDRIVERYNKSNVDLKSARARLKSVNKSVAREQRTFNRLRGRLVELAASAYKTGDMGSVASMVSSQNPQTVLDQAAVFTHLARNRSSEVGEFLATAQRLQREQAQARSTYNDVKKKASELVDQKKKVEKAIAKQQRFLPPSERGGPIGGNYNGPASGSARKALDFAFAQLGKPYSYGATGPGSYDCSGLTQAAWRAAGVNLPRTTYQQINAGNRVSFANLQPGDLFFGNNAGHVGLYVGGGKIIHAPRTGKNVEVVPVAGYYQQNFAGAVRP
jgi:peptidoglycan DL-endopeptidase CwlO